MTTAKTPIGNTQSYLPVAEFLNRCDRRTVAELCSDDEERGAVPINGLPNDPNLRAALLDASSYFESAVLKSKRYSLEDFQALPTQSPGQALMYTIIADICIGCLFKRRPSYPQDPKAMEAALGWLNRLSTGAVEFPFEETVAADLLEAEHDTTEDVLRRNGISTITRRFMGRRANIWDRR